MTDGTDRRCVRCDLEPGYNRAVLDLVRDVEIGSLCRNCEFDVFDVVATGSASTTADSCACALCERDGFYALPRWLPATRSITGDVVSRVDYELDDRPIYLCDEHYDELIDTSTAAAPAVSSARERQ